MMAGGHSSAQPATEEIQKLAMEMKAKIEDNLSKTFTEFHAESYRQQVVAGMIYHIKVETKENGSDEEGCVHVRIFQPLPYTGDSPVLQAAKVAAKADPLQILDAE